MTGRYPDWDALYDGFVATVDWPGAAFWRPPSEAYPEALVLLSVRDSADAWFQSADQTINRLLRRPPPGTEQWQAMVGALLRTTFAPPPFEEDAAKAAYERHNAAVREGVPAERLLEWKATEGWGPLCERLGVPVPPEPFPRANTLDDFRAFLARPAPRPSWRERARRVIRR